MPTRMSTFRMMVSWDRAVIALDRAVERGHQHFEVVRRDNGLLRLRRDDGVIVEVEIRIETPTSTVLTIRPRRRGIDLPRRTDKRLTNIVETLQQDVVRELRLASAT